MPSTRFSDLPLFADDAPRAPIHTEYTDAQLATILERRGWTRAVAGADDFAAAVTAYQAMLRSGKGLVITGKTGCGKTRLARTIFARNAPTKFIDLRVEESFKWLSRDTYAVYGENPYDLNIILDDLGAEKATQTRYNPSARVRDFISSYFRFGRRRLTVTSNLSGREMAAFYGEDTLSRLAARCIPLRLTGRDKRCWEVPG